MLGSPTPNPDLDGDGIPERTSTSVRYRAARRGTTAVHHGPGNSDNAALTGVAPTAVPVIALPVMPITGDCVLATRSDQGVNIRIQPSTSAEIVGVLNSQTIYPVNGQQDDADGVWDRIEDGWVARRVVRVGGDCDAVPDVTPHYSEVTALQLDTISCDVDELIKAIEIARSGDTINLAPGCIYTLTKPYKDTYFGLPAIRITLKIKGNGATIRRSSDHGTPAFGIFYLLGDSTVGDVGLTLTDVAIRNGKSASDLGPTVGGCSICGAAAIDNDGGNLVVNNATFAYNTEGGAIFTDAALDAVTTATITNSSFFRNSAHGSGAAINNAMTMTVTDSTFSDNSALAPYSYNYGDGEGGAIFNYGTLTVNSSTFSNNSASGDPIRNGHGNGGAIANEEH